MEYSIQDFYADLDTQYASGDTHAVEQFLQSRIQAVQTGSERFGHEHLVCLSELGAYYRGVSRYGESADAFQKAAEMIAAEIGPQSAEYATNLNNMAGAYRMAGDYDTALRLFLQSIELYDALPEKNNYLYAGVLNNISILYQMKEEFTLAIDYLLRAIGLLEESPKLVDELATGYTNLASLYQRTGNSGSAWKALDESIRIFNALPHESPHYAAALNTKAVLLVLEGKLAEAKDIYLQVLEKIDAVFGRNADYAMVCNNLSQVCAQLGDTDGARRYLREELEIYTRIYGADHPKTADVRHALSVLNAGVTDV